MGNDSKNSSKYSKKKKKKKQPLTVMDYVTIGFTAVIVVLMGVIVLKTYKPEWFTKSSTSSSDSTSATSVVSDATEEPSSTAEPSFTDIGNNYANMTTDSRVAEIDGKIYFEGVASGNQCGIYVTDEDGTRLVYQDNAFSINVITDPYTFYDTPNATGYMVVYIDANGYICRVTDGPYKAPDADEDAEMTAEKVEAEKYVIAEGNAESITVVGSYVYYLLEDGTIGRISLTEDVSTVLSRKYYSSFCVYYGAIYALNKDDGSIYLLKTTARTEEPEEGEEDEYEMKIIDCNATSFSVCNDWLYVTTEDGIIRYDLSSYGKDTLSSIKADAICVLNDKIYYIAESKLYVASPADFLKNTPTLIGEVSGTHVNALNGGVYSYNKEAHRLTVSYLNTETGEYGELTNVALS